MTAGLVAVLTASGLALTWFYRPDPEGASALQLVHRSASALLLPASWVLVFAMVRARWGAGRVTSVTRWVVPVLVVPVLVVLVVLVAAFTGFLLPWEDAFVATAVVPPDLRGMGLAFDSSVSTVSFGGAPITRAVFQRYVLAHLFLGTALVALTLLVVRSSTPRRVRRDSGQAGEPGE